MNFEALTKLIRDRKTTYADCFSEKKLTKKTIEAIVTNGLWAPTHKLTQPWRFVVLEGKHHDDFGAYMANYYRKIYSEEQFSTERYEETKRYPKNATLLAIVFQPSERAQLPEWEEIAAISCAIQNMWLSCTALNIGCYWDTGSATINYGNKVLDLAPAEKCLGILYMGHVKETEKAVNRKRKPLSKKLTWDYKQ